MKIRKLFLLGWALGISLAISCNREPVPPPEPAIDRITVAQLHEWFGKGIASIDTNVYIRGIVTLTPELNNLPAFIAYLQDSTAGICLTVAGENTFATDSEVKILLRGAKFTEFNGLLQLGDIDIAKQVTVLKLTAGKPAAVKTTISELLQGKHQSRYVEIDNVQFKQQTTYSGTKILTDCDAELEVYTRSDATFASKPLPQGNGSIRGIASAYTDIQLLLRDETDHSLTGNRCGQSGKVYLSQDFTTLAKYADVSTLTGWKTYAQDGTKTWYGNEVSPRKWVQATAYQSNHSSVVTWMVSPDIDLAQASKPSLSFDSANGYDNGATLSLFISSDYGGSVTPWTATWVPVTFTKPASSPSGYSQFVSSGNIDLSAHKGKKVNIAWVYAGADPSGTASDKTTTWEVDNVLIVEK